MPLQKPSIRKARKLLKNFSLHPDILDKAIASFEAKNKVKGYIVTTVKGGFLVNLNSIHKGMHAFLPGRESGATTQDEFSKMEGKTIDCTILEVKKEIKNIVVSTNLTPRPP